MNLAGFQASLYGHAVKKFRKFQNNGCISKLIIVDCFITDKQNMICYIKGGIQMKTKPTRNVSCPQCGTEVEGSYYTYMMECNRCLAKKDE